MVPLHTAEYPQTNAHEARGVAANDAPQGAATTKKPRRVSAYDLPTPEKRQFGARMREARELAGMSLTEAAEALGYSAPVQMSLYENGLRMPPTELIPKLATLFGTTADFLFGLVECSDRDPLTAVHRSMAAGLAAAVRGAIVTTATAAATAMREDRPQAAQVADFARRAVEVDDALAVVRARPGFDDLQGGARLVRLSRELSVEARGFIDGAARLERRLAATKAPAVASAVAGLVGLSDELLAARLGPFAVPIAPEAEDDESKDEVTP